MTPTVADIKQKARQAELAELLHLSPGVTSEDLLDALDAGIQAGITATLRATAKEARRRAADTASTDRAIGLEVFAEWLEHVAEVAILADLKADHPRPEKPPRPRDP